MVEFNEAAWLEKLDKVQTTEELTALILEIPLDPLDAPKAHAMTTPLTTSAYHYPIPEEGLRIPEQPPSDAWLAYHAAIQKAPTPPHPKR